MKHVVHTVRSQGSTGDGIATAVIRKSVHDFTFLHHADSYGGLVVIHQLLALELLLELIVFRNNGTQTGRFALMGKIYAVNGVLVGI